MVLNRIGLTGATGLLGRHLRAALEMAGAEVVAVSRRAAPGDGVGIWNLAEWKSMVELDVLFNDVQAIVHAGAMVQTTGFVDEGLMFDTNVRACVNLGQWAVNRKVPIVHISSSTVYDDVTSSDISEEAPLGWSKSGNFYGLTKLLAEDVLNRLRQRGLKLSVVRPSSLYGYGLPSDKIVSAFLAKAREGETIKLDPPIDDRVDFIHAADVSCAIMAILKAEAWDIFNVASGRAVSIKEMAEACVLAIGKGSLLINQNKVQLRDPITRFALNTDRARSRLGWQPVLDIKQGLRMMHQECIDIHDPRHGRTV